MTAWTEMYAKRPGSEITKTDWDALVDNQVHLYEPLVESEGYAIGGVSYGGAPAEWALTFTLPTQATVIFQLDVQVSLASEGTVTIMPRLNNIDVAPAAPYSAHSGTGNRYHHVVGFLIDVPPGAYTIDFMLSASVGISDSTGISKSIIEVRI